MTEEYEKGMMKFKKKELVAHLWKIREKTKALRNFYKDTQQHPEAITKYMTVKAIKTYLGEK